MRHLIRPKKRSINEIVHESFRKKMTPATTEVDDVPSCLGTTIGLANASCAARVHPAIDAAAGPTQLFVSLWALREVELQIDTILEAVDWRGTKACEPKGSANRARDVILIVTGILEKDKCVKRNWE
jgi:hypothetical protein